MAQNVTIAGVTFADVPSVEIAKSGGGSALFVDPSPTTATAADVASGKSFFNAAGTLTTGTASGGGGDEEPTWPTDGHTHLWITTEEANTVAAVNMTLSSSSVLIDWGDGSTETTTNSGDTEHTYAAAGDYEIVIQLVTGSIGGSYGFNFAIMGTQNGTYAYRQNLLRRAYVGNFATFPNYMFTLQQKLEYVCLAGTPTALGTYMFAYCQNIKRIRINASGITTIPSNFAAYSDVGAINIPSTVTSIQGSAFRENHAMKEIHIPAGVTTIPAYAFHNNYAQDVYVYATTPPTLSNATTPLGKPHATMRRVFHVPAGTSETYKDAQYWSTLMKQTGTSVVEMPA